MTRRDSRSRRQRPSAPAPAAPVGRRTIIGIGGCSLLFLVLGFALTRDRGLDVLFLAGLVCTIWGIAGLIAAVRFALTTRA